MELLPWLSLIHVVCCKRAKVNCVRCKTCKKWVHARCARVKRVSCRINGNFECSLYE